VTGEKAGDKGAAGKPAAGPFVMPDFSGMGSLRAMAMGAGDMRVLIVAEVERILAENDNNPVEACREGLARLHAGGAISRTEASQLGRICVLLFQHQRARLGDDAMERIIDIYRALAVDPDSSPVALAIASSCASFAVTNRPPRSLSASSTGTINMAVGGGAIAGALFGLSLGGLPGAALGGMLGGLVGGIVGAVTSCVAD